MEALRERDMRFEACRSLLRRAACVAGLGSPCVKQVARPVLALVIVGLHGHGHFGPGFGRPVGHLPFGPGVVTAVLTASYSYGFWSSS